jgi:hypothetical protein
MEQEISDCQKRKLIRDIRNNHPSAFHEIRMCYAYGTTSKEFGDFQMACLFDVACVAALLLQRDPELSDFNELAGGCTALDWCCSRKLGVTSTLKLLLQYEVIKVDVPDKYGLIPIDTLIANGDIEKLKVWIASGREIDFPEFRETIWETGSKSLFKETVELYEKALRDPNTTRHFVRKELRWYDEQAAKIFALIVFLCDNFLVVRAEKKKSNEDRFFSIATRLPMELQVIVCQRLFGQDASSIPRDLREEAFLFLGLVYGK